MGKVEVGASEDSFILIEPKESTGADNIAKAIAMCHGVRKVFLTSGRYGFVVAAKETSRQGIEQISATIVKTAGKAKASILQGHFVYERRWHA